MDKLKLSLVVTSIAICTQAVLNLPMIVIVGLISIAMLWLSYRDLIYYTIFLLPFTWHIPGYIILILYALLLIKGRNHGVNIWQIFPPLILALLEVFHLSMYEFSYSYEGVISICSFIALFFYLLFLDKRDIQASYIVKLFCYGTIVSLLLSYYLQIDSIGWDIVIEGGVRSGIIEESDGYDEVFLLNANSAAYFAITAFACLMLGRDKLKLTKVEYIILLFTSLGCGLLSYSRTFIIVSCLVILLTLLVSKGNKKIYYFLSIAIVALLVFWIEGDRLYDVYMHRFNEDNISTVGGRSVIFKKYNDFWLDNPRDVIFGIGVKYYSQYSGIVNSMHNGIQQVYVCFGIVGFIIYAMSIIKFYNSFCHRKTLSLIYYIPIIACFIFDQSIQFLNPQFLMFPFIGAAYALKIRDNE